MLHSDTEALINNRHRVGASTLELAEVRRITAYAFCVSVQETLESHDPPKVRAEGDLSKNPTALTVGSMSIKTGKRVLLCNNKGNVRELIHRCLAIGRSCIAQQIEIRRRRSCLSVTSLICLIQHKRTARGLYYWDISRFFIWI